MESLKPKSKIQNSKHFNIILYSCLFVFIFVCFSVLKAQAASLSIEPSSGTFSVDSIFDVSLFLNTEGEAVNTIAAFLKFPSDRLQLISPTAGKSIISLWTSPPKFDNKEGSIELQGGIPGGINTSKGLVTKLTFRVKSIGTAIVKFIENSRVLLNDGLGTDALNQTQNGIFRLVLPPPAGPVVISETHPDQLAWYHNSSIVLSWAHESDIEGYSYVLNDKPVDLPDDISEGIKTGVSYKNLSDGKHYFHIKAMREGNWGGITHFAVNIDTTSPAEFPVEIIPDARTTRRQPVIQFATTDSLSGISHYELKIVPLQKEEAAPANQESQPFFIEAESPYVTPFLGLGTYDVIIVAYDNAGNYREAKEHLKIVTAAFKFVTDKGLEIKGIFTIPWLWFWVIVGALTIILVYLLWHIRQWHYRFDERRTEKRLPEHIKKQLEELKEYQNRYGKTFIFLFLTASLLLCFASSVSAQIELGPPIITTASRDISNEEIFYIGGKTEISNTEVIIYLQNIQTGATLSYNVYSDKYGDWFYRHNSFLESGDYLLWVQSKADEQLSPPSPQVKISVRPTAFQLGSSRLSYEIIYLVMIIILLLVIAALITSILLHGIRARKKKRQLAGEIKEAEEAVRIGFAILRKDIESELSLIRQLKLNKTISAEEKKREEQLLKDLRMVEQRIGKEVWDIERFRM